MLGNHRVRVRVVAAGKTTYGKIKSSLGQDLYIADVGQGREFVICADSPGRLEEIRGRLWEARLEAIVGTR